jgi:hypothetical protein
MTAAGVKKLKAFINHKSGVSQRQLARKFGCSQPHIGKTLKGKTDIRFHKRIAVPYRTEAQTAVYRPRSRRISLKFHGREFIIDDESYFTLSNSDKNANGGYYSNDVSETPDDVRCKEKKKFEQKLLVWLAISPKGMSQVFITRSGQAVNQDVYREECIRKRLMPFIKKHHSDGNFVFWPDLASSHYAKSVLEYLKANNVVFVEKKDNPPCAPRLRPIENFWSILKGYVYDKGWEAEKLDQLKQRIKYCLKKADVGLVQRMMLSVPSKLDAVRRYGAGKE